jgi:hypothetical protein
MPDNFEESHKIETYKSMISISVEGFKVLVLLNGGAIAGILSSFQTLQKAVDPSSLKLSVFFFVAGLTLAGAAPIGSYMTQVILYNETMKREKDGAHLRAMIFTLALNIASIASFAAGALVTAFNLK